MSGGTLGLQTWLIQRFTAVYLALFIPYLVFHLLVSPPVDYSIWLKWISEPLVSIAFAVAVLALMAHAWVGVRDVLTDYIHTSWLKLGLMSVVGLVLLGSTVWLLGALVMAATAAAVMG